MRGGWGTTVALLPLLLLAGTGDARPASRGSVTRAATLGIGLARGRGAAAASDGQGGPAPVAVSVGGDVDTGARFSASDAAPDSEPVIVELQIGRIATRTVQAYRVGTEALVPMSVFLQM